MNLYEIIFNPPTLKKVVFLSIKTITKYPNVKEFSSNEPLLHGLWEENAKNRYDSADTEIYLEKGCYLPELCTIQSIGMGMFYTDKDNNIKRHTTCFYDTAKFFEKLDEMFKENGSHVFCGHNITGYTIPFLIKIGLKNKLPIPKYFRNTLKAKPWESNVIDTVNLWKFGGNEYVSLNIINEYLKLDTNFLAELPLLSKGYHNGKIKQARFQEEAFLEVKLTMDFIDYLIKTIHL